MLETERLILRPWCASDAESLYEYARDPQVGPAAGWQPHASVEESRAVIETVLSAPETYAVCLRDDNRAIGSIGLMAPTQTAVPAAGTEREMGYWIGVPFWGRGLIPEAVRALTRHAFETLGCTALWCGYYDGNEKSRRAQMKCGFTYHHTEVDMPCPQMGDVRTAHFTRLGWERRELVRRVRQERGFTIRPLRRGEEDLLDALLYDAIFVPEGTPAPPRDIILRPELRVYTEAFGSRLTDRCLVAEQGGKVCGGCLTRIMDDYGHVDDETPSFLVAVFEAWRGRGMGTALMEAMLAELADGGHARASLSVQKDNYAVRMYRALGFEVVDENEEDFIMVKRLV